MAEYHFFQGQQSMVGRDHKIFFQGQHCRIASNILIDLTEMKDPRKERARKERMQERKDLKKEGSRKDRIQERMNLGDK